MLAFTSPGWISSSVQEPSSHSRQTLPEHPQEAEQFARTFRDGAREQRTHFPLEIPP